MAMAGQDWIGESEAEGMKRFHCKPSLTPTADTTAPPSFAAVEFAFFAMGHDVPHGLRNGVKLAFA